jgi:glycosyltransferase involved in cell wall biosynthesis
MPGFKQYSELAPYYGFASAFIHPSTSEPWGLVVNEAMASRLPVLVSERCGCARDLVRTGQNGFTFDPSRPGELSQLMLRISTSPTESERLGRAGAVLISRWGPERFARGLRNAAHKAVDVGACSRMSLLLFVRCLLHR